MIRSFASRETERLFSRERVRRIPPNLQRVALRKLRMLHRATSLEDLRVPPANRLEVLKGSGGESTASASTISSGSASDGTPVTHSTSRS